MNRDRDKETATLHPDPVDVSSRNLDQAGDRSPIGHPKITVNKASAAQAPVPDLAEDRLVRPTLHGFYTEKKTNPTGFLKSLKQTRAKGFSNEDTDRVIQEFDALDPLFQKTLGLAQKSFASGPSSPTYWCLEWIGVAVVGDRNPYAP